MTSDIGALARKWLGRKVSNHDDAGESAPDSPRAGHPAIAPGSAAVGVSQRPLTEPAGVLPALPAVQVQHRATSTFFDRRDTLNTTVDLPVIAKELDPHIARGFNAPHTLIGTGRAFGDVATCKALEPVRCQFTVSPTDLCPR
jgi:hypothetical protein